MKSAAEHPDVIDAYLPNEDAKGRVAGPFATLPFPHLQCSPFGVIPKKGPPGKWRLILDLSSLNQHSVNDGIPKDLFSLQYISVDDAIRILMHLGRELSWLNLMWRVRTVTSRCVQTNMMSQPAPGSQLEVREPEPAPVTISNWSWND
jgi:hypothetical protein